MYAKYIKRGFDLALSFVALIVLSPILLILTIINAAAMRGNPFFIQTRPGKKDKNGQEKIFNLVKFRTMSNKKDDSGNLLPDEKRIVRYGKLLRSLSIDELPELWNICKGDMSIVGPRPLLVKYLPLYTEEQRQRHNVRPGLTGYAQVHGRNSISWEEKFRLDLAYINRITFIGDVKIVFATVKAVLKKEGISSSESVTMEEFQGSAELEKIHS